MDEREIRLQCLRLAFGLITHAEHPLGSAHDRATAGQVVDAAREFERFVLSEKSAEGSSGGEVGVA
jgi:hypothetical protein